MEKNREQNQSDSSERMPVQRGSNLAFANSTFAPMRMFDDLFRAMLPSTEGTEQFLIVPRVDVEDRDDEYCVTFDIPGVPQENIAIEVVDNQLTVSAERKAEEQSSRRGTRFYGAFQRTLMLPTSVDAENIRAEYENGVLTLHIPRNEKSRPRRIEVQGKSSKAISGQKDMQEKERGVH
ncbi:MAG: Hsp20/alpha crystallin family protein [Bdellovibrionales bacterium]